VVKNKQLRKDGQKMTAAKAKPEAKKAEPTTVAKPPDKPKPVAAASTVQPQPANKQQQESRPAQDGVRLRKFATAPSAHWRILPVAPSAQMAYVVVFSGSCFCRCLVGVAVVG